MWTPQNSSIICPSFFQFYSQLASFSRNGVVSLRPQTAASRKRPSLKVCEVINKMTLVSYAKMKFTVTVSIVLIKLGMGHGKGHLPRSNNNYMLPTKILLLRFSDCTEILRQLSVRAFFFKATCNHYHLGKFSTAKKIFKRFYSSRNKLTQSLVVKHSLLCTN